MHLTNVSNFELLYENIKSEVDFESNCYIGLGRRMPIPISLQRNLEKAQTLKQKIYARVVEIWGDNN